jgi:hyperosmotically inducible periplasmic protein
VLKRTILGFVTALVLLSVCSIAPAQTAAPAPDNSGTNVRDRNPEAVTADQQSNSKSDLELTRRIRRAIMKDHSLSMTAHNVKIITDNGAVTLRGPVDSELEKNVIEKKAQAIAGADKVDDRLEVKQ